MYQRTTPVRYIKGIGPTRSRELVKLGIEIVGDLLNRKPLSYIYPGAIPINEIKNDQTVVVKAKIKHAQRHPFKPTVELVLADDSGSCKAVFYHSPWILANLRIGTTAVFYGKYRNGFIQNPRWTTVEPSMAEVYGGQYGTHHNTIRTALKEVLSDLELPWINVGVAECDRVGVYINYHFPDSKETQRDAEGALKFDEALCLQLALAERRAKRERVKIEPLKYGPHCENETIIEYFPYSFTQDQDDAIDAIIDDLAKPVPMQRLLHGEVGSGKTAVAFYAAMLAALNGKRTLILAPTTILAQQHYETLRSMGWDDVGLMGNLRSHRQNIVIGTHNLLYDPDLLESASLVIIDEFHRFGVEQRSRLHPSSHLLLLSATPIPRTLAATVFGDLDVSVIRQLPIQRGQVITRWVLPEKREGVCEIIERELQNGHQVYWIFPRIGDEEQEGSAVRGFNTISKRFSDYKIALLTSRTENKDDILRAFKDNEINILVGTTIMEVGLDCSNATVAVIENADRFGLATLHQIRGRVCRSKETAYCFLVAETANQTSIDRLEVIEKCNDGFEIAEHDLRLRGPGEVFSTRQHGLPDLVFLDLIEDFDLIAEARDMVAAGDVGEGVKEMARMRYNLELGGVV